MLNHNKTIIILILSVFMTVISGSYLSIQNFIYQGNCANSESTSEKASRESTCTESNLKDGSIFKLDYCQNFPAYNTPVMFSTSGENIIQNVYHFSDSSCQGSFNSTTIPNGSCNDECKDDGTAYSVQYSIIKKVHVPKDSTVYVNYPGDCNGIFWKDRFTSIYYSINNKCIIGTGLSFSMTCNSTSVILSEYIGVNECTSVTPIPINFARLGEECNSYGNTLSFCY